MVGVRKKKFSAGEGARYMSRKEALRYLQLSLKYFRKLCILKGIYPREPNNRSKAQKGKANIRTLYAKKDIQFLSHEPIIWKLRDIKVFSKKMGRAYGMQDFAEMKRQLSMHPTLTLDHIIKERYPTFVDALRDLDDCLSLVFLFSTFPSLKHVPREQSALCRRLSVEFLHACIVFNALRKVFVSIKGYYFQVELFGQTITWITPHHFSFQPVSVDEVDFRIMSTFVELYTVMLGFVNFHLFNKASMVYPPKLAGYGEITKGSELVDQAVFVAERVAALNLPLQNSRGREVEDYTIDELPPITTENDEEYAKKEMEIRNAIKQKSLFKGLKVFLNREVPREPLVFVLRCLGAEVSWDELLFVGATFPESDESITHQIVDRPSVPKQFLSRYYVQPQWVFDSVNACQLLPVGRYLIGAVLPPHLSPFVVADRSKTYEPPEEQDPTNTTEVAENKVDSEEIKEVNSNDDGSNDDNNESDDDEDDSKIKGMRVTEGTVTRSDPSEAKRQANAQKLLLEKMVNRKHRNLYKSIVKQRKTDKKEIWLLRKKRKRIDAEKATKTSLPVNTAD